MRYPVSVTDSEEAGVHPIDEQTVLVTGATSGLGRALVQRLAGAGATAVAHGRGVCAPTPTWTG